MDDQKNPNQNPLDPVVPTTPIADVPPAPESPSSEEGSIPPIIPGPQQDVPPPPVGEQTTDMPLPDNSGLPPVVSPPPAKSKTKLFAAIAAVVLLLVSIPAGIVLVRQQQELRGRASVPTCECKDGIWQGADCTTELGQACSAIPPQCPDGEHWEGPPTTGSCVPNSTTPTCPSGEHWEGPPTTGACVPNAGGTTPTTCTYGEACGNGGTRSCTGTTQDGVCKFKSGIDPNCSACTTCGDGICGGGEGQDNCPVDCKGGGGSQKIRSEDDGQGGCCDQGAAANSPKGCRTTGGFNEVCDIANGSCQSGFSCRSLAGCSKDTDCGPGNKCVNSKCESGGGGSPAPSQAPTPTATPVTSTCNATLAGIPAAASENTDIATNITLNSSNAPGQCEYVSLYFDNQRIANLKAVNGQCIGGTYSATFSSGSVGNHTVKFVVNDSQAYPNAPSRTPLTCATQALATTPREETGQAYCTNLQVVRGGAPITDLSKIQIGDHLNLQATCVTTSASLSFDKIRFRITAPSGAKPDQDQTATKDITARIQQVAEQPNIYKATGILTIDRIGSYNIKVWGHTKEDNKWKGKQ